MREFYDASKKLFQFYAASNLDLGFWILGTPAVDRFNKK